MRSQKNTLKLEPTPREILADLFSSLGKRAEVYHWRVNGNKETISDLLGITSQEMEGTFELCGFLKSKKMSATVFNKWMGDFNLDQATLYAPKVAKGTDRDKGLYVRLGSMKKQNNIMNSKNKFLVRLKPLLAMVANHAC